MQFRLYLFDLEEVSEENLIELSKLNNDLIHAKFLAEKSINFLPLGLDYNNMKRIFQKRLGKLEIKSLLLRKGEDG
ncbi:hypothetical protein [Streptococcus sp. E17BB]|uniref:hypothetical protein n=1 Tax=Streptococcus sp. E17BB TaxID=3278714 RepID=UPI0035A086E1